MTSPTTKAQQAGWMPIATAPRDGRMIAVLEPGHEWGCPFPIALTAHWTDNPLYRAGGYWKLLIPGGKVASPTGWLPLPAGPEED